MSNYDDLIKQLRGEFIDEVEDNLSEIELVLQNVRTGGGNHKDSIIKIRRHAHSLKGSAGVAGFPVIATICHRLEDYIDSSEELSARQLGDIEKFLEVLKEYADLSIDQEKVSTAEIVRTLPKKHDEAVEVAQASGNAPVAMQKEALLVIREKTAGLLFERELKKTGMHVTIAHDSISAFGLAVRMKPDVVFVSGVVDVLDGIDLACALKAMPYTRNIPVCLLTSFDRDHAELKELPPSVLLLQKSRMREDLPNLIQKMAA